MQRIWCNIFWDQCSLENYGIVWDFFPNCLSVSRHFLHSVTPLAVLKIFCFKQRLTLFQIAAKGRPDSQKWMNSKRPLTTVPTMSISILSPMSTMLKWDSIRAALKKIMGLFGNFSQMADPPPPSPPFGNPLFEKQIYRLFCILGP